MSLLVFSGSTRADSANATLARAAARKLRRLGVTHTLIDLADFALPLYHGDVEAAGLPGAARVLRELFAAHDGFVIASPEYNGSVSPLLKNTLDWVSRQDEASARFEPYAGKTALILSTSPGGLGGQRAQRHLREILTSLGALVVPQALAVPQSRQAFDEHGELTDAKFDQALTEQLSTLAALTGKLAA